MSGIRAADQLSWFEVPRAFVEPLVRFLRLANTALDVAFYDVNSLIQDLHACGLSVITDPEEAEILHRVEMADALRTLDLATRTNSWIPLSMPVARLTRIPDDESRL
jgi:hypothetical protein